MYKTMAKFNNECYDIVDMFLPQRNFKVVCFAIARNFERNFGYQGFVREIQNRISAREDKHKYLLDRELKLAEERHSKLLDTKGTIA